MQFKITMINMLKAQMEKGHNMYQQMGNISRVGNNKKESSGNASNQKHSTRDEEYL